MGTRSHYLIAESLLPCPPGTEDRASETGKDGGDREGKGNFCQFLYLIFLIIILSLNI